MAKKELSNQHRILEDSRRAAIHNAANLLDQIAKAKELGNRFRAGFDDERRSAKGDDKEKNKSDDFLFDYLKLSADYLNQLSKMGERYATVAHRALENLYAIAVPDSGKGGARNLEFGWVKDEEGAMPPEPVLKRKFVVQNDVDPEKDIVVEWPRLRGAQSEVWIADDGITLHLISPPGTKPMTTERVNDTFFRCGCTIPFGALGVIEARINQERFLKRKYETEFVVKVGKRRRTIPVSIDLRDGPPRREP